jgi:hypothetical protein
MRTEVGRRYRDLVRSYAEGLGVPDEQQMSLVRTAAGIGVKLEAMQAAIVNGAPPVDTRLLIRLANSQARALRALGEMKAKAEQASSDGASTLAAHLAMLVAKRKEREVLDAEIAAEETKSAAESS